MTGPLTGEMCRAMLLDPNHLFRRMWAAEQYGKMSEGPACWERVRDHTNQPQAPHKYFQDVASGVHCNSNWYEGNQGELGWEGHIPFFGGPEGAPALLGFDETIDKACKRGHDCDGHAECCVKHSMNILSLYGQRLPYNICRNLEWQTCAARGLLPGQKARRIVFAQAPNSVAPDGSTGKPLGVCGGWTPPGAPKGGIFGYATEDIFYLEVCMFHQICRNGDKLFQIGVGWTFVCDFDQDGFDELESLLLSERPPDPPDPGGCGRGQKSCAHANCDCTWANTQSCSFPDDGTLCNRCCCARYRAG